MVHTCSQPRVLSLYTLSFDIPCGFSLHLLQVFVQMSFLNEAWISYKNCKLIPFYPPLHYFSHNTFLLLIHYHLLEVKLYKGRESWSLLFTTVTDILRTELSLHEVVNICQVSEKYFCDIGRYFLEGCGKTEGDGTF